ncbi:MAG TPA: cytochrome c-type biogenesis protein CcmH [Solirubrobacteraceae bacterium]|nr:cytochrome c-type biogenesis protein CcmH [Solirubrobacteraceae bacterium]
MRRASALALVLAAGAIGGGPASAAAAAAAAARASLPAIEREVMCVTCKIPLELAQSPQADRERAFIATLIGRGYPEAQIKRALVVQYGTAVLALPSAHGFDLAVYVVPLAALLAVLALVAVLLPRWRRAGSARVDGDSRGAHAPPPMSPEDAARVAADLARFD